MVHPLFLSSRRSSKVSEGFPWCPRSWGGRGRSVLAYASPRPRREVGLPREAAASTGSDGRQAVGTTNLNMPPLRPGVDACHQAGGLRQAVCGGARDKAAARLRHRFREPHHRRRRSSPPPAAGAPEATGGRAAGAESAVDKLGRTLRALAARDGRGAAAAGGTQPTIHQGRPVHIHRHGELAYLRASTARPALKSQQELISLAERVARGEDDREASEPGYRAR